MFRANETRYPRASSRAAPRRTRSRLLEPEIAQTAMWAEGGRARGRESMRGPLKHVAWSGPVSRILFPLRGEDHSSVTRVAAVIEQPTRKLIAGTGGPMASLFGLAPQGVYRAVAAHAGRGALLPHRFTLASFPWRSRASERSAVCFLLHFPSRRRAWPLASLLPVRVRTFLQLLAEPAILRTAPRIAV